MSSVFSGAQLFLVAAAVFLLFGSVVAAVLTRVFRGALAGLEPRVRHQALTLLLASPLLIAVTLLISVSVPSFASLLEPASDHCFEHNQANAHLCFTHLPTVAVHAAVTLGLVFLVTYWFINLALMARTTLRAEQVLSALVRTGEEHPNLGVTLIESSSPLCFTGGLFRSRVFFSRCLLTSLGELEQSAILLHEHAHVRRRDVFWANLGRGLGLFHFPWVGTRLRSELELAAEQTCDEESATAVGDRLVVACAIISMAKALRSARTESVVAVAVGFGGAALERRVQALLAEPLPSSSLKFANGVLLLGVVGVFAAAHELHHFAEVLLAVVAY